VTWLWGDLVYIYAALTQLRAFPGFAVDVATNGDGAERARTEHLMLVIANANIFGGGFKVAPGGKIDDGQLDAVSFLNMRPGRRLAIMGRLMKGTHEDQPEIRRSTAPSFRLRFDSPPAYELDGEWNQAASAELLVESVPRALQVLVPAGA
jgi:diacylglycerol kinase family enzyme